MRCGKFKSRRGMTAVLAMLYLALFSTLAVGFYAAVNTSVQLAANEQQINRALLAADSAMSFVRYQLDHVNIDPLLTDFNSDQIMTDMYSDLCNSMNGTGNLAGGVSLSLSGDKKTIYMPAPNADGSPNYIYLETLGTGPRFYATITHSGDRLVVKVVGGTEYSNALRAIQLQYQRAKNATAIFNYGVASNGKVATSGSAKITTAVGTDASKGSVLSTSNSSNPVDIEGAEVAGDISIVNPTGSVTFGASTSIGGSTNAADIVANHIHKGVSSPEFPTIDTTVFSNYATNTWAGGTGTQTLTNTVIPSSATKIKFTGSTTINGVLYVKAPNNIEFSGNTTINGVIVVENGVTFDSSKNVLNFSGNVTSNPVSALPSSYGNLRSLTGSFVLAPGFLVNFAGDFGTVNGSIIAGQVTMTGNAGGTVQGTVINLENQTLSLAGSSEIVIASTGTTNYPSGVYFGSHFAPLPGTYDEVLP